MLESLWKIVSGAPWWVYVLFVYLLSVGVKAIRPRTVPIQRVVLLPILFLIWALYGLYTKVILGHVSLIPIWIIFLGIGAYLGVREVHGWRITKDHHTREITIPGNYSTLVLMVFFFAGRAGFFLQSYLRKS